MGVQKVMLLILVIEILLIKIFATTTEVLRKNNSEYRIGNSCIIITAPHGGLKRLSTIPTRKNGCLAFGTTECIWQHNCTIPSSSCRAVVLSDARTKDLAIGLWTNLKTLTGKTPHLIYSNLHRSKLDPNREMSEAAQGSSEAENAYKTYHGFIASAIETVNQSCPAGGILFDIHGHGHPEQNIELGYLITREDLNDENFDVQRVSIRALYQRAKNSDSTAKLEDYINGEKSFGKFLVDEDYGAVPSPTRKCPGGSRYFKGGYTTAKYGSSNGGSVDAIQIESPRSLRKSLILNSYSKKLANAIKLFVEANY